MAKGRTTTGGYPYCSKEGTGMSYGPFFQFKKDLFGVWMHSVAAEQHLFFCLQKYR